MTSTTVYTLAQIINQLTTNSPNPGGTPVTWPTNNLTFSFPTVLHPDNVPKYGTDGFSAFNANQQTAVRQVLDVYSEITPLIFTNAGAANNGNNGDLRFHNVTNTNPTTGVPYAEAYFPGPGQGGDAFFNSTFNAVGDSNNLVNPIRGTHGWSTYLHEIGHAMGLNHPGQYPNGGQNYLAEAEYRDDSLQFTVMSYFDASNTGADHIYNGNVAQEAETLLLHDIAALHAMYGANPTTRNTATVYGFGTNIAGNTPYNFATNRDPVICIYDAAGVDTLNFSGFATETLIDLTPGAFSNTERMTKNVSIAFGTIIENAVGGSAGDKITGNSVANLLQGGNGSDRLFGLEGADTLQGGDNVANGLVLGAGSWVDNTNANNSIANALNIATRWSLNNDPEIISSTTVHHTTVSSTVTVGGPSDFYRIQVNNVGAVITADVDHGVTTGGQFVDTQIRLLNAGGTQVAINNQYLPLEVGSDFNNDPLLTFSVVTPGTYYVVVDPEGGGTHPFAGTYELNVSVQGEINPGETLDGGAGDDILQGNTGIETLIGGPGSDKFYVDNVADVVSEVDPVSVTGGTDTLFSTVTKTIAVNVEKFVAQGPAATTVTGNAQANNIDASQASGANTLAGLTGNDIYTIRAGDTVVETAGNGLDTVNSFITHTLAANVENLNLLFDPGNPNINGTGNGEINVITGNSGNNTLNGGDNHDILKGMAGLDIMTGSTGNDDFTYVAFTDSRAANGIDQITDFKDQGADQVDLRAIIPGALAFQGLVGFTGANQVRVFQSGADTTVQVNLDGNTSTAEMTITLLGTVAATVLAGDFLLT